jgi:hypothetical protein
MSFKEYYYQTWKEYFTAENTLSPFALPPNPPRGDLRTPPLAGSRVKVGVRN